MERLRGTWFLLASVVLSAALVCGQNSPAASPSPASTAEPQAAASPSPSNASQPNIGPIGPPIASNAPHISKQTRLEIIRDFETQLIYSRTLFPMGTKGLSLKDGTITPNGSDLQQLLALWGPAIRPGDPAHISFVEIKDNHIRFDINGGAIRRKKWYQHIEVVGAEGEDVPLGPNQSEDNPHGSYLDLVFDRYVPEMTVQQLRDLLLPALDFNARSKEQAYLDTVPPKVKQAILSHYVLVGMNSEMVLYAKGRPPKKDREKDGETQYEEWIYGEPPQDVDFVRFVGDEVVRVETMKVGGEKIVRTQREVFLDKADKDTEAKKGEEGRPANAPSLRRPGEDPANVPKPTGTVDPMQPVPPPDIPQPQGPNDAIATRG
jgi:hypothetical protein